MRSSGVCQTSWQPLPCKSVPQSCPITVPFLSLLWSTPFLAYKKEGSAGDITIDVHRGPFSEICNHAEMQRGEYICLTDSEGSTG